jgi:hypothetical protein
LTVHPCHDRLDLLVQLGDLLVGGIGGKNVDELVLSICHCCSFWTSSSSNAGIEPALALALSPRNTTATTLGGKAGAPSAR